MSNEAFVTLATNDTYGLGALVLGRSLRRVATSKQTVVLITTDVSQKMKEELGHVFNLVVTVDTLDSGDAAHLALMSRPELGVTFTKLHAWRLVQFSKCVFLDADTLVVQNCDELFEREELSAAPDPGWPDCFNSGVFVFVPSEATFKALLDFAVAHGSFDGGDQGLLNMFFSDWATGDIRKHLPFIYNVVSSTTYSYLPALKQFGSQVKIAHFLGNNKPWLRQSQVGTSSPYQRAWWSIFREDVAGRLSQDMIVTRPLTGSSTTSILLPSYRFKDPWDFVRYENEGNRKHAQHTIPYNRISDRQPQIYSTKEDENEGNRKHVQHTIPYYQIPDRHPQINPMREEHLSDQFVTLPPPPKVFNSFQSNTEPVVQETTYLTTPTHIENIRYEHHNYDEENSRTVRSNVHSEVARSYINYTIPDSEYKAHSFDSKEDKSFDAQTEKKTSNINNTGKKNVEKPMNTRKNLDHQHIPINAKWNHEIKMYPRMENNNTHFSFKQSLSKPEAPIINVMDTPKQSIPTSHTKYNEVKKKIDKRDTATKIDHKIIRSDKLHESRPSKNLPISSKSAYKNRNSEIDRSTTVANPSSKTLSSEKILHKSPGTNLFTTESRKPQFEHQINCLNIVTRQEKSKIDNDVRSNCSISRVGFGTVGTKAPQCNPTNTHDKHDDNDLITNNMIQQNSHRTTCDGNQNQDNAGVPGVLARGEPDDWRREAWEAGDVDYLGRDSFDNIWKRICECVGITAQTLSAPAAPAATSAGIANQPSAPETDSEKIIEAVSETVVDAVPAEKPVAPITEKSPESVVPAQKPAEPPAGAEKPVEPLASVEKPVETVVSAEKPLEPVVSAEKPVESVVSAEKLVEAVASTEKPLEPVVSAEKSVEPAVAVEKPVEPAVSAEKPIEPAVAVQKPVEPVVSAEKPVEPAVEKPAETVIPTEKPAEPIVTAEKTTEPVVTAETLTAAVKPSEPSPPVPENTPEAAPAAVETPTVVDKEKSAESTPSAEKPTESSKVEVISAEKTVEPVPTEEKSVIQEAPVVEKPLETPKKPAEPVTEAPIKATIAEKPVEPAVTLTKPAVTEAAPTDKKAEPAPTLEKPVEVATSSEKPAEAAPETVKPTETPEICPLKPSEPKSAAPGTPTSSEPSLKSGEARIQPPLVGEDAPVCKKEPGTPTITPPSGPASPQPADVPPEVCKLQATPSQPATPPASSHQTTDAPVPPKRKQGKNGKSGKGKK